MRKSRKPVRRCGKCPLNQGRYCWGFTYPREQWRNRKCPAFADETAYSLFYEWQEHSRVKTLRQIRREAHRKASPVPRSGYLEETRTGKRLPGRASWPAISEARAAVRGEPR